MPPLTGSAALGFLSALASTIAGKDTPYGPLVYAGQSQTDYATTEVAVFADARTNVFKLSVYAKEDSPHWVWSAVVPSVPCGDKAGIDNSWDPCADRKSPIPVTPDQCVGSGMKRPMKPGATGPNDPWFPYIKTNDDGGKSVSQYDTPKPEWNLFTIEGNLKTGVVKAKLAYPGLPGEAPVLSTCNTFDVDLQITPPEELALDIAAAADDGQPSTKLALLSLVFNDGEQRPYVNLPLYIADNQLVSVGDYDRKFELSDTFYQLSQQADAASLAQEQQGEDCPAYVPSATDDDQSDAPLVESLDSEALINGAEPELQVSAIGGAKNTDLLKCTSLASIRTWMMFAVYDEIIYEPVTLCPGTPNEIKCQKTDKVMYGSSKQYALKCVKRYGTPEAQALYDAALKRYHGAAAKYAKCPWKNMYLKPEKQIFEEVFLVFSGTDGLDDNMSNLNAFRTGFYGGLVHAGFWNELDIHRARWTIANNAAGYDRVTFMGHSRGGAVANLAAIEWKKKNPDVDVNIVTMAAPAVVNDISVYLAANYAPWTYGNIPNVNYWNQQKTCGDMNPNRWDPIFKITGPLGYSHSPAQYRGHDTKWCNSKKVYGCCAWDYCLCWWYEETEPSYVTWEIGWLNPLGVEFGLHASKRYTQWAAAARPNSG